MKSPKCAMMSFLCFTFVVMLSGYCIAAGEAKEQPNIVFLLADDLCSYSVGCYGNKDVLTPNIDKLGRDGVIFDKHYNTTAICMASRANVLTGMYEYKTGCNFVNGDLSAEVWEKSYPVLLRKKGYLTAFAGKFGIEVKEKGLCESDFDFWGGGPGQTNYKTAKNKSMTKYAEKYPHSTLSYGAFGQDVIEEANKRNKPFCLSISFKAPHKPATADPRFNHIYAGKSFTKPANFGRKFAEHLAPQSKTGRQYPRFSDWKYDTDYDGEMAKYHQQVYAIDVAVGMIREKLDAMGVSAVIIFTSDNGYICGSHGYGSKVLPMEESSRTPLIIYNPYEDNQIENRRSSELTGNIDMAPTILDLAGIQAPSNMDGKSLLPLYKNQKASGHDQMAFMNCWSNKATTSLTCLTKQYKYTYWWYQDESMKPTEELFDTQNDPLELKNLATDSKNLEVLKMMRKKYDQEIVKWNNEVADNKVYKDFGILFDRSVSFDVKSKLLGSKSSTEKKKKQRRKKAK